MSKPKTWELSLNAFNTCFLEKQPPLTPNSVLLIQACHIPGKCRFTTHALLSILFLDHGASTSHFLNVVLSVQFSRKCSLSLRFMLGMHSDLILCCHKCGSLT